MTHEESGTHSCRCCGVKQSSRSIEVLGSRVQCSIDQLGVLGIAEA